MSALGVQPRHRRGGRFSVSVLGGAACLFLALPAAGRAQGPPAAPINLSADIEADGVELTWEVDPDAKGREPAYFRVYREGGMIGTSGDEDFSDGNVDVGQTYVYEVSGVDIFHREGARSAGLFVTVPDDTPPSRPGGLVATAVSGSQIELTWNASHDDDTQVVGYLIYRDGSNTPHDSVGATGYTDTGLAPYTEYEYRVSALNVSGAESSKSSRRSARTHDPSPPTAPTGLQAQGVSGSKIELQWNEAADPESGIRQYLLYRNGGGAPFDSTSSESYTDSGLAGYAERTYEVAAMNESGHVGARSNVASARPLDDSPPGAISGLSVEAPAARRVALAWDATFDPESGVSLYLIYRNGDTVVDSTTSTSYMDESVEPETEYAYRVSARNGDGFEGPRSSAVSVTTPRATDETPPSAPGDFTALQTGPTRIELAWSAATDPESGIFGYRVYRDGELLGTSPGGGFTDLTVEAETAYGYAVSAVNGDGLEGALTDPVSITVLGGEDLVPPAAPTNLRVITE